MSEEVGINYKGVAIHLVWNKEENLFTVRKREEFESWLTNPATTTEGKTVGELNREHLHKRLDAFLDAKEWD